MAINMKNESPRLLVDIPNLKRMYSLEGIDGAGKSTQARRVVESLIASGHQAVNLRAPSGSPIGEFLRSNIRTLQPWQRSTLFLVDYITQLKGLTDYPGIVVWDRYTDSDIVSNKDLEPEIAAEWVACLPHTRRTFYLEIHPDTVLQQRSESVHDHSSDLGWQQLKFDRYRRLIASDASRFSVIDANQPKEIITRRIVGEILNDSM